jgi:hypothetical protein
MLLVAYLGRLEAEGRPLTASGRALLAQLMTQHAATAVSASLEAQLHGYHDVGLRRPDSGDALNR